ncbi:hypothetical protein EI94DRAFT_1696013 [Lactarius quietus]|nr:hypothetical protein EI94DRAFT_1696013 [Lactarius quietus]
MAAISAVSFEYCARCSNPVLVSTKNRACKYSRMITRSTKNPHAYLKKPNRYRVIARTLHPSRPFLLSNLASNFYISTSTDIRLQGPDCADSSSFISTIATRMPQRYTPEYSNEQEKRTLPTGGPPKASWAQMNGEDDGLVELSSPKSVEDFDESRSPAPAGDDSGEAVRMKTRL